MEKSSQKMRIPVLSALTVAVMLAAGAPMAHAQAQPVTTTEQVQSTTLGLPDFTGVVAKTEDGVVNIRTTEAVRVRSPAMGPGSILTICSAGSLGPISCRPAWRRSALVAVAMKASSLKSAQCHVVWVRVSSSLLTATS